MISSNRQSAGVSTASQSLAGQQAAIWQVSSTGAYCGFSDAMRRFVSYSRAIRFVLLLLSAAGAIATPRILQLSGIGDAGHLQTHGIEVIADSPGVGEHYQDPLGYLTTILIPLWPQAGRDSVDPTPLAADVAR